MTGQVLSSATFIFQIFAIITVIKEIYIESLIIQGLTPTTRGWRRRVRFPVLLDAERLSAGLYHVAPWLPWTVRTIVSPGGFLVAAALPLEPKSH